MTGPVQERRITWTQQNAAPQAAPADAPQIDFGRIMRAMRRQMPLVAICAFIGVVVAVLMILGSVPRYMAIETVLLDEERADLLNEVSPLPNAVRSDSTVQSEIEIIKSQALAYQVVDRLDLDEDPAFLSPPTGATDRAIGSVMALTDPLARLLSPPEPDPAPGGAETEEGVPEPAAESDIEPTDRDRAAAVLRSRLGVSRSGRSFVIEIAYKGYDPVRSAVIARAYGSAYENFQLTNTTEVAGTAEEWLRERLKVLEQQSIDAAAAVQEFRAENDLLQVRGDLLTEQQQSELASELVAAAADTAEAKAQLDSMESLLKRARNGEEIVTVPQADGQESGAVSELRQDYLDARSRYNRLVEKFGKDHPQVQQMAATIDELQDSIQVELEQAAEGARVSYNVARSREQSLRSDLENATSTTDENVAMRGRLQQLEAISETYAEVYRDYLKRLEVTLQQQGFPIASVKVISQAEVPKGASSPQKKAMLIAGMILGGFLGITIGAGLELMAKPVRTSSTLRDEVGINCAGLLPSSRDGRKAALRARERALERLAQVCEERNRSRSGTLIGIAPLTSELAEPADLPAELATRLARNRTRSVLVLDGSGAPDAANTTQREGYELVGLHTVLDSYAAQEAGAGLPPDRDAIARDLRAKFDFVLLLMPPLSQSSRSDPEAWAYDLTVLRIPWGRALPGFISDALRDHLNFHAQLATTVLEGADLRTARRYMSPGSYEELEANA